MAERISGLKKVGVELPVISELPVPAERVKQVMWTQERLPIAIPEIRVGIPVIVHGKAYGKTAGMWYRVTFPRPVADPSVVCVAEARRGEVPRPPPVEEIEALVAVAKEKIPDLTIPIISIRVPRWEMHIPTAGDFVNLVKKFFGDWGWLNWARDAIAWAIGNFEYSIWNAIFRPRALERLNSEVLVPIRESFESTRDAINAKIADINDRLEKVRTQINTKLEEIDDRLETLRTRANDRLAGLFPRLYAAWGFPVNMTLTPLHIRNVTDTGFEFQSYGMTTCYYLASGSRR